MTKRIALIRHGKTIGNLEKRYIGITDEPLCPEGIKEIKKRCYPKADLVFCSPLLRCKETAGLIYPKMPPVVVEDLKETDFGRFEGRNACELSMDLDYQLWLSSGGEMAFPDGESQETAVQRSVDGFVTCMHLSGDAPNISFVVHGGTIMAIVRYLFGGDYYSYQVENGEGYTFELSHNGIYSGLCHRSYLGGSPLFLSSGQMDGKAH